MLVPRAGAALLRRIDDVFLNQENDFEDDCDDAGTEFAGISGDAGAVVVVDGDEEHLEKRGGAADQVEDHHADGEALRRLAPVVEHHLRRVFDETEEGLDVAEDVDGLQPRDDGGGGEDDADEDRGDAAEQDQHGSTGHAARRLGIVSVFHLTREKKLLSVRCQMLYE